jgi:asparagine synthase (glutamine-hydrolysing)
MCGIVGVIDGRDPVPEPLLACLRDVMAHRGPDGTGMFRERHVALAMRRLAVIDVAGGGQPLTSQGGQVVAFQNGEIYNHAELRRDLESDGFTFHTASDTEALAHGYARWGIEGLLERLDGMYALAVLDRTAGELHVARDRFGEKPLFYAESPGRFAYASDLRALAALPWVDLSVDAAALDRYLALHYVPGSATFFRGVRRVLPGQRLRVRLRDPRPEAFRYYRPELGEARSLGDDALADRIDRAVRSRLVSDVPVGVFLSGGLDSSVVAALAARHRPGIDTFSMGFTHRRYDESPFAGRVAGAVGSRHHHFVFDESRFRELLPLVASALDEPLGDQALLPLFWLCAEARRFVTVTLAGEGADEVFAGYGYYREALEGGTAARTRRLAHNPHPVTPSGFPLLADAAERERLCGGASDAEEWEQDLVRWLDTAGDPLQRGTAADLATWLPDDLLVKFDRMAMAHGLEGRAPYLQPALVDAGLRLPPTERFRGGTGKVALRRVAARWVGREILDRPKHGFILPMEAWLQEFFQAEGGPSPYFAAATVPGLDRGQASVVVAADLRRGVKRPRLVFALVALVEWHRAFAARVASLRAAAAAYNPPAGHDQPPA